MEEFARPDAMVDAALFTLRDGALHVVLARRDREPYQGQIALPGAYVHIDEDENLEAAARRMLREKTGIEVPYLEQLYTFGGRLRDPRRWSLSVAYYALVPEAQLPVPEGAAFQLVPADRIPALPFDHDEMMAMALRRLRGKSSYSSLPAFLLPETFTLSELQSVYEQVIGTELPKATFRRRIEEQGIVEPTGETRSDGGRPAQLYRRSADTLKEFDRTI